ncbi:MAG: glycosyltransferase family 9 protein [Pseudomonadota bacterium]|nr:glycosyltransferase family 9 protein [Pseudomonadota bacterium]
MIKDPCPQSILVYVGGDLLGDALIKLPFVRALKGAWPNSHLTWLAGTHKTAFARELAPLVAGLIDEIIEEAGFESVKGKFFSRPLGGRYFDLLIDTQRGVARSLLVRRIRHKVFVSGAANFLFSDLKPAKPRTRPPKMINQMMELISLTYGAAPPKGPPLWVDPAADRKAADILPSGPVYVGFAPGAGGPHKRWPLNRYLSLAGSQIGAGRTPVFILGPGEMDLTSKIRNAVPGAIIPEEQPRAGHLETPILSIAISRRLRAAVANDSGVGHILAAGETPLVSLFGPTLPDKFAPATPYLRVIRAQEFGGDSMEFIPEAAVGAALEILIS